MRDYPSQPNVCNRRAIFLDRDGTINIDTHYPHKISDLILLPNSIEGMELLSSMPFDIIVVSNQGGIALELYKTEHMSAFNSELKKQIHANHGRIDAFYYCPHFELKDKPAEVEMCSCSKPLTGMLTEASNDFEIDLSKSYMVGDRLTDIAAGNHAGCTTILISNGSTNTEGIMDIEKPDYIARDLLEVALIIKDDLLRRE
ncbi:D-glycero-beta-D-manno-heptose-1,7-bisphosphate 7-phosphatase [compost metagenome]